MRLRQGGGVTHELQAAVKGDGALGAAAVPARRILPGSLVPARQRVDVGSLVPAALTRTSVRDAQIRRPPVQLAVLTQVRYSSALWEPPGAAPPNLRNRGGSAAVSSRASAISTARVWEAWRRRRERADGRRAVQEGRRSEPGTNAVAASTEEGLWKREEGRSGDEGSGGGFVDPSAVRGAGRVPAAALSWTCFGGRRRGEGGAGTLSRIPAKPIAPPGR